MKTALIFLLACLLLNGCLLGNAEGYGNKPTDNIPSNDDNRESNESPFLKISIYYLFDPSYTCFSTAEQKTIPSYRNAIYYTSRQVYSMGDRCNPVTAMINMSEVIVPRSGKYLGYHGGVYQQYSGSITDEVLAQTRSVETFCFAVGTPNSVYEVVVQTPIDERQILSAEVQLEGQLLSLSVVRTEDSINRTYSGTDFSLSIQKEAVDFLHTGFILNEEMRCFLPEFL